MLLSDILKDVKSCSSFENVWIDNVCSDSRKIDENCVFVCVKGKNFDSHNVAKDLENKGVKAFVVEHDTGVKNQIVVDDTRKAYSIMCDNFYGNPSKNLKMIGITGTNGKTTTAFLIKKILEDSGHKCGLIGTVEYCVGDDKKYEGLTTPTSEKLFEMLNMMVNNNCEYCIMEVSSQALAQSRVHGIEFDRSVFTNLTQDHLDYHGTMKKYAKAKKILFQNCKTAIMNNDDKYAGFLLNKTDCDVVTYSIDKDSDFKAEDIDITTAGVRYVIHSKIGNWDTYFKVPGRFSVYNSLCAITCCTSLGIPVPDVLKSIGDYNGVAGRAEVVETNTPYSVIIDYAHTPDSLENIIKTLNEFKIGNVITVFGCGGDRDKSKRPKMGRIATSLSDIVVVTSDNPRTEDPTSIINDILKGVDDKQCQLKVLENRTQAIEYALEIAKKDDIVLLAGKGHETYQIIGTEKNHYDEREIIINYLNSRTRDRIGSINC